MNKKDKRFYWIWNAMKNRCDNPKFKQFKDYGGRGINYCDEWRNFKNFEADMKNGYEYGLTLDRIDTDKNYCKENCKWSTHKEQNNNKRCCHWITYDGQTKTLSQWADLLGIKFGTMRSRFYRGMTDKQILNNGKLYRPAKL